MINLLNYISVWRLPSNSIPAKILPFAVLTAMALPNPVEVVGGCIHQRWFVGEDAGLEVAVVITFHAYAGTCEVGGTDVGHRAVENHYLEMHPWAESPFQSAPQSWILVEILAEILSRLFGMKQAHFDTPFQKYVEHRQERHHVPTALHIQVFEVGSTNPQIVLDLLAKCQHFCVVFLVRDVLYHTSIAV